jgi:H2-forming N5,N10-methylenetetrahydromethanopterin dehydrogenase-like enzyme
MESLANSIKPDNQTDVAAAQARVAQINEILGERFKETACERCLEDLIKLGEDDD